MTSTSMPLKIHVESRPGAVIHNDVAVMNVPSRDGARYFVTLIDEASGHVRAFLSKPKAEAAELLEGQVCWVERPSGCTVKNIVLDCGREYLKS